MMETDLIDEIGELSEQARNLELKLAQAGDEQEEYVLFMEWAHLRTSIDRAVEEYVGI